MTFAIHAGDNEHSALISVEYPSNISAPATRDEIEDVIALMVQSLFTISMWPFRDMESDTSFMRIIIREGDNVASQDVTYNRATETEEQTRFAIEIMHENLIKSLIDMGLCQPE